MLHVGWSIDRTGQPLPLYPVDRSRAGSCASAASAAETVRGYVASFGSHDGARMLDCFAIDYINASGLGFAQGTADLPEATIDQIGPTPPTALAGRVQLMVTWTFETDPGTRWVQGQHGFVIFTLGVEDGRYRIFEGGTGAYGPPP